MAEILVSQAELDRIFERMRRDYARLNKRQQAYAIREIGRIRSETSELLAEYADSDGVVKKRRLNRLLRDLEEIEQNLRKYGDHALSNIIEETSEWTTREIARGLGVRYSQEQFDRINRQVVRYVINRFGDDGLVLSDRIWGLSGEIRDELSTVIRTSIIRGDGINAIVPRIRQVYDNETWKIRRLARTESLTAHRAAISYNAQESEIVKWVQFHEGDDRSEACVALAERDKYGKGKGVYKTNDTEIWMPHPNCTSYITYIIDERWL